MDGHAPLSEQRGHGIFGIAYIHHFIHKAHPEPRGVGWKRALIETLVHLTYTYIIGVLPGFIFIPTGHLIAPFLAHAFCNFLGLPNSRLFGRDTSEAERPVQFANVVAGGEP
eukprot:FR743425.1.p2 GENE.FR743425.1~~FR743425.1.p2  ORF type:complete len:112 (+),score=8.99 FR743425.1:101-436(+)